MSIPLGSLYSMTALQNDLKSYSTIASNPTTGRPPVSTLTFKEYVETKINAIQSANKEIQLENSLQLVLSDIVEFAYLYPYKSFLKESISKNKDSWLQSLRAYQKDLICINIVYHLYMLHHGHESYLQRFFHTLDNLDCTPITVYAGVSQSFLEILNDSSSGLCNYSDNIFISELQSQAELSKIVLSVETREWFSNIQTHTILSDTVFKDLLKLFSVLMTKQHFRIKVFNILSKIFEINNFEYYGYYTLSDVLPSLSDVSYGNDFEKKKKFFQDIQEFRYGDLLILLLSLDNKFYFRRDMHV